MPFLFLSSPFCSALCLCMYFLSSYFSFVVCRYLILFMCFANSITKKVQKNYYYHVIISILKLTFSPILPGSFFSLLHTTPHYCIRSPLYLTNVLYAQSSDCLHQQLLSNYGFLLTHIYILERFRGLSTRNHVFCTARIASFELFTTWWKAKSDMKSFLSVFPSLVL